MRGEHERILCPLLQNRSGSHDFLMKHQVIPRLVGNHAKSQMRVGQELSHLILQIQSLNCGRII